MDEHTRDTRAAAPKLSHSSLYPDSSLILHARRPYTQTTDGVSSPREQSWRYVLLMAGGGCEVSTVWQGSADERRS